ncbi:MAG: hypothetical protein P8I56_00150, partial [Paracoccaceae bacterium]|nr:hypothetical protein [Paracoccaceae bacterium]
GCGNHRAAGNVLAPWREITQRFVIRLCSLIQRFMENDGIKICPALPVPVIAKMTFPHSLATTSSQNAIGLHYRRI